MRILLSVYSLFSRFACRLKSGLFAAGILKPKKAPLPVVSVGNITLGGTEKTPLAMELLNHFLSRGFRPALVTRGYRGNWERAGGMLSDGRSILGTWKEAGDEPAMVALAIPQAGVFIGKDRLLSCQKAKSLGFDIAVLDDGFQHVRLHRDLDIVLHDLTEPAALREGRSAFRRADVLLLRTGSPESVRNQILESFPGLSIFEYSVEAKGFSLLGKNEIEPAKAWLGKKVLGFCGIARPRRFFSLLEECGLFLAVGLTFPDHFAYPDRALEKIARAVQKFRPEAVVTTEKDAVKITGREVQLGPTPVAVLRIELRLSDSFREKLRAFPADSTEGRLSVR